MSEAEGLEGLNQATRGATAFLCLGLRFPHMYPLALAVDTLMPPLTDHEPRSEVKMSAQRNWGKDLAKAAFVALPFFAPLVAGAKIDYDGVGYLGGSDKIDLNNANVRVYSRFPGLYPTIAGKIVSHGPYKSVSDVFSISGLSGTSPETTLYSSIAVRFGPAAKGALLWGDTGRLVGFRRDACQGMMAPPASF